MQIMTLYGTTTTVLGLDFSRRLGYRLVHTAYQRPQNLFLKNQSGTADTLGTERQQWNKVGPKTKNTRPRQILWSITLCQL